MHRPHPALILCVLLCCSCSAPSQPSDGGVDDAEAPDAEDVGTDAWGDVLARREALLYQVGQLKCQRLKSCYPVRFDRVYGGDEETCVDRESSALFALRADLEFIEVDEVQVEQCLESIDGLECHHLISSNAYPIPPGCDFRGTKQIGEPCLHRWACSSGQCSIEAPLLGWCEGYCQERIEPGEPCDFGDETRVCGGGSRCDILASRCLFSKDVGDPGQRDGDNRVCPVALTSIPEGECELQRRVGEDCAISNALCQLFENLRCNRDPNVGPVETCIEAEPGGLEESCEPGEPTCEAGLRCNQFFECREPMGEGESCSRARCHWDLACVDDVCRRPSLELCAERAADETE